MAPRLRQRLSLTQIGLGVLLVLLALAIEWIILTTYQSNQNTTRTFGASADFVTLIANVLSETLRLQAETERFLRDPSIGVEPLELRRAFVINQLRVAVARTRDNAPLSAGISEFQATLDEYAALLDTLQTLPQPLTSEQLATSVAPQMDDILGRAILQINRIYIQEELLFDEKISQALAAQGRSQMLLLGLSALVLALTVGFALSLGRSVQAQFQQAYALVGSLEEAVAERTRDLARAAEVGQSLAAVRELDRLLEEAAALIQARFRLSHTRIFLADATGRALLLRAEAGAREAGGEEETSYLPIDDRSPEGQAAARKSPVLLASSDLGNPTTLSVPLVVDERVIGILTLESQQGDALTESTLPAFQVMAGQLAIAIENANLFAEIKRARAEIEAQARRLTREGWSDYLAPREGATLGFLYDLKDVALLPPLAEPQEEEAALVHPLTLRGERIGRLSVARVGEPEHKEEALALVAMVATQLSAHLENLRLFQQVEEALEEAHRTAERLRELDRLKSAFLANMSHELRTPLNSIIGYTEVLLMGISGPLNPEAMDDVGAIRTSSYHLLGLINDILDLAKIEAGHLSLLPEQISVESLLDTIRANYEGLLHNKPISLVVQAADDLPLLWADSLRLSQVITNLLSNAVKFTEQGTIWLRAYQEDSQIIFEVEDSGIGMSDQDLQTIFEEFHQVDSSHARRAQGTGLGLAITRHLVTMHGGTIDVRSELGKGSTFIVKLPIASVLVQEGS